MKTKIIKEPKISSKVQEKKREKRLNTEAKMKVDIVPTPARNVSIFYLITKLGVKNKIEYYNLIETRKSKKEYSMKDPTYIKDTVHDLGLEFNDGLIIRHVENEYWKYCDAPVVRIKERR